LEALATPTEAARTAVAPAWAYRSLSSARRVSSASSAPTRKRLMEPHSPWATTPPPATMEARVRVPPPSIPKTACIFLPLQSFRISLQHGMSQRDRAQVSEGKERESVEN